MSIHLIKLCVGAETVEDHRAWIQHTLEFKRRAGLPVEQLHTTRMIPKRKDDLLQGGSLYWVIKGLVQSRQRILDIRPFKDAEGIQRCHIVLEPEIILTRLQLRRAFQGWRYLKPEDAPEDIAEGEGADDLPPHLQKELSALGLL
jgi:hypothetical protein